MIQVSTRWLQAIKDVLRRLVELMEEWQLILTQKSRGTFHEPVSSAAAKSVLTRCHPILCLQSFLGQIWSRATKYMPVKIVTALLPLPICSNIASGSDPWQSFVLSLVKHAVLLRTRQGLPHD